MTTTLDDVEEDFDACMADFQKDGRFLEMMESAIWLNGCRAGVLRALTRHVQQEQPSSFATYEVYNIYVSPNEWECSSYFSVLRQTYETNESSPLFSRFRAISQHPEERHAALNELKDRLSTHLGLLEETMSIARDLDVKMEDQELSKCLEMIEKRLKHLINHF
jgi:hypothetical protein